MTRRAECFLDKEDRVMDGSSRTLSALPDTSPSDARELFLVGGRTPTGTTVPGSGASPVSDAATPAPGSWLRLPSPAPRLVSEVDESDQARFLRLIRSGADPAMGSFLRSLERRGVSTERIIDELVTPTARWMGEAWMTDECTFVEVTLMGGRLQQVVRSLVQKHAGAMETGRSGRMPRALLTSLPGEQHTLGLTVLSAHFRLAGWDVRVGPPVGRESAIAVVRRMRVDVVGITISRSELLASGREEIRRLRAATCNDEMGILVGGPGLGSPEEAADVLDADGIAPTARLAPQVALDFT
ncbi:MAG: hypothetical protein EA352_07305 [Gemmatimonadales bacterium]|nr:MAG: hypothetical protein EA352_07305 [Gemmatimonadales bacterium]